MLIAHGGSGLRPIVIGCIFRKNKNFKSEIVKKKGQALLRCVHLPDRTLFLGAYKFYEDVKKYPLDKLVICDIWQNENFRKKIKTKYFMANFHFDKRRHKTKMKLLSDSGALQLARKVVDFINPIEVAKIYDKNNIYGGITIDMISPSGLSDAEKLLNAASIIQRRNTEVLIANCNKTKIFDVIHGHTYKIRTLWANNSIVPNNPFVCCGAKTHDYKDNMLLLACDIYNVRRILKQPEKAHIHLLGHGSSKLILLLPIVEKYVKEVTADAVTGLQASFTGGMHHNEPTGNLKLHKLGRPPFFPIRSNCICPVCNIVKYSWVYTYYNLPLAYHNMFALNTRAKLLSWGASDISKYLEYIKITYPKDYNIVKTFAMLLEKNKFPTDHLTGTQNYFTSVFNFDRQTKFVKVLKSYISYHKETRP